MTTDENETDVILVTCNEVLADPEFREWLSEFGETIEFLATVSRSGEFQLLQRTMHGTRVLRKAHLDLDALFASPEKSKPPLPLFDPNVPTNLPAILRLPAFPLRLSHHISPQQSWRVRHYGALAINNDRRLMHWDVPQWGAKQLSDQLPSRRLLWSENHAENGRTRFVVGNVSKPGLHLGVVDFEEGHCELFPLDTSESHVQCVCAHAGVLFVIHRYEVDVCTLFSGERVTTVSIPRGFRWSAGRYFRRGHEWKVLSFNGVDPCFEDVGKIFPSDLSIFALFDVEGIQGPVGIATRNFEHIGISTSDEWYPLKDLSFPFHILHISPNGKRVMIQQGEQLSELMTINIPERNVTPIWGHPHDALNSDLSYLFSPRHYRNRIKAIGTGWGGLLLHTSSHIL
ncbi:MAG: hypothetical protein KDA84_18925, partial [Planctomycetaceae bacterium]|nr:hypothetical protein [Planctomycetaceae bacterium]